MVNKKKGGEIWSSDIGWNFVMIAVRNLIEIFKTKVNFMIPILYFSLNNSFSLISSVVSCVRLFIFFVISVLMFWFFLFRGEMHMLNISHFSDNLFVTLGHQQHTTRWTRKSFQNVYIFSTKFLWSFLAFYWLQLQHVFAFADNYAGCVWGVKNIFFGCERDNNYIMCCVVIVK